MDIIEANALIDRVRAHWLARANTPALNMMSVGKTKATQKRRDDACLHFLVGALSTLPEDSLAHKKLSAFVFLVMVRGASMFENPENKVSSPEPAHAVRA